MACQANAVRANEAATGEKESFSKQLEAAQLQADYHNLRRFVYALLEDAKRQARLSLRSNEHQLLGNVNFWTPHQNSIRVGL